VSVGGSSGDAMVRDLQAARSAFDDGSKERSRSAHGGAGAPSSSSAAAAAAAAAAGEAGHGAAASADALGRCARLGALDGAAAALTLLLAAAATAAGGGASEATPLLPLPLALAVLCGLAVASGAREALRHAADVALYARERARELWEFENYEEGEKREMVEAYEAMGVAGADASAAVEALAKYPEARTSAHMHAWARARAGARTRGRAHARARARKREGRRGASSWQGGGRGNDLLLTLACSLTCPSALKTAAAPIPQVFVDLMMAQELRLAPPDAASPLLLFAATAGAFLAAGLAPLAAARASSWGAPATPAQPLMLLPLRQLAAAAIAAALVLAGLHVATLGASQRGGVVAAGVLRALGAVAAAGAAAAAVGIVAAAGSAEVAVQ
jgi:hypothetical protein